VFTHTQYMDEHRPFFNLINMTWAVNVGIILICIAALLILSRRIRTGPAWPRWQPAVWAAMGIFASLMMTVLSDPLSARIPMIEIGVFSWRMLGITTLIAALLAGAVAEIAAGAPGTGRVSVVRAAWGTTGFVILAAAVFSVIAVLSPVWDGVLFVPEPEHLNPTMVPRTALEDPEDLPEVEPAELDQGAGQVFVKRWLPQHREIDARLTDPDTLWVRTFNYPGWTATVDGNPATIDTGPEVGDIHINLDAGNHEVVLDFVDTPIRRSGRLATLASGAAVCALLIAVGIASVWPGLRRQKRRTV